FAEHDLIGHVKAIDGRTFGAIDFGPLVAKAFEAVAFGQRRAFPDARRSAGELADQTGPIVDVARRAVAAVGRFGARGEAGSRTADSLERSHQILREVDAVNRHVEQIARARFVLVLPPAPACLRPVQESLAAKMPQLAERATRREMPHVAHRWGEAIGE